MHGSGCAPDSLTHSEVVLAGAEVEVETVEEEEGAASKSASSYFPQFGVGGMMGEKNQGEEEESDLSRFAHDHAYTFSKPPQEPFMAR